MKMMPLAIHITEDLGWPEIVISSDKIDFASADYKPVQLQTKDELINLLEENFQKSWTTLNSIKEEDLDGHWTMNLGDQIVADFSKYGAIRHALNQITHHRAQLSVYFRLNDIALPASYGPSADTYPGE